MGLHRFQLFDSGFSTEVRAKSLRIELGLDRSNTLQANVPPTDAMARLLGSQELAHADGRCIASFTNTPLVKTDDDRMMEVFSGFTSKKNDSYRDGKLLFQSYMQLLANEYFDKTDFGYPGTGFYSVEKMTLASLIALVRDKLRENFSPLRLDFGVMRDQALLWPHLLSSFDSSKLVGKSLLKSLQAAVIQINKTVASDYTIHFHEVPKFSDIDNPGGSIVFFPVPRLPSTSLSYGMEFSAPIYKESMGIVQDQTILKNTVIVQKGTKEFTLVNRNLRRDNNEPRNNSMVSSSAGDETQCWRVAINVLQEGLIRKEPLMLDSADLLAVRPGSILKVPPSNLFSYQENLIVQNVQITYDNSLRVKVKSTGIKNDAVALQTLLVG